jgi:predicted regulator of Ras-like GTPase activity (Roadblock/LC7/MglB family)
MEVDGTAGGGMAMVTRESELMRVLKSLEAAMPRAHWIALVDSDGLPLACVPENPPVKIDNIAAMSAAAMLTGQRVLNETEGGQLRFTTIAGSKRQVLIVTVDAKRYLAIGLEPDRPSTSTFGVLARWVPEILSIVKKRSMDA